MDGVAAGGSVLCAIGLKHESHSAAPPRPRRTLRFQMPEIKRFAAATGAVTKKRVHKGEQYSYYVAACGESRFAPHASADARHTGLFE